MSELRVPQDISGRDVRIGDKVKLLSLSGQWLLDLPEGEKIEVMSMIGDVFEVTEIDEYGYPWVGKSRLNEAGDTCRGHSIALESYEMELVDSSPKSLG